MFGGKPSGAGGDVPFGRYLVHHNRVEQTLLAANDWGGIETWQGGPFYVYNNISANPGGLWWPGDRLGFAFYLDGGFKNYLFNNIAWGANNTDKSLANAFAFYEAVGTIHNSFMNNTIYRFKNGTSWSPRGGHHHYAGNLWSDISKRVYNHGKLKEDKSASVTEYPHETMAYGPDVFHKINAFGFFENLAPAKEKDYKTFAAMEAAVRKNKTLNAALGTSTDRNPMRDPAKRDMRLTPNSIAIDKGVTHFVPWALYGMVGEWNFYHDGKDVNKIPDEHWYMTDYLSDRGSYYKTPQFPLTLVNCSEDIFVSGPLESWIKGAIRLNGKDQYAVLANSEMNRPFNYTVKKQKKTASGSMLKNPEIHGTNFLIEIYFKATASREKSILVEKMGSAGYSLTLNDAGRVVFSAVGKSAVNLKSKSKVDDGKWHHVLAEADRKSKNLTIYVDGKMDAFGTGLGSDSLASKADLYIGGSPKGNCLNGSIEFVRICQGTLEDARTTIDELHTWQFKGPHLSDFVGKKPSGKSRDAGALELTQ